ncbi:MAG: sodium-dependent transporter, partial [Pararhodobacter sp.]|nr:sodium-dependent transporter [Pararhodobacter sp.]
MLPSNKPEAASVHGIWAARWIFILAASGSAIGLGNIWKFPYITGEYGGGAFVLVYLLCVLFIGMPVMVAEVLIGRRGRAAPIHAVQKLSRESGVSPRWGLLGWLGTLSGFLILSFYSMIAGWTLYYIALMAKGSFAGADAAQVKSVFDGLLADPYLMLAVHSLFMAVTIWIVAGGVHKGLERAVRLMMPALVVLLFVLLGYAASTGHFMEGARFLFHFDLTKLNGQAVLVAMGHAFFTLSLGMGAIMAYGAYMPHAQKIGPSILAIATLDTVFALLVGLAIFPIVFAYGLEPGAGPGLMFVTLPLAFGNLPMGSVFGFAFFVLVALAAWTSAISIAEPFVAWAVEKGLNRLTAASIIGMTSWFVGIFCILSFNWMAGEQYHLFGRSFFDGLDFLTTNILLPLGGILIAVFAGWVMKE